MNIARALAQRGAALENTTSAPDSSRDRAGGRTKQDKLPKKKSKPKAKRRR
jgi:hypothetical protein